MHIITSFSKSGSEERNKEYSLCFEKNNDNKFIKSITVLSEDVRVEPIINYSKVKFEKLKARPTFRNIIDYVNNNIDDNETVIITNADIYFDNTLQHVNFDKEYAYCLTRWHKYTEEDDFIYEVIPACHDTWILKTPIIVDDIDFHMGVLGCDSRLSYQFFESGYLPINPSYKVKCYHMHVSNIRTWKRENILCGDYLGVKPTNVVKYSQANLFKYNGKIVRGIYKASSYVYSFDKKNG